MQQAAVGWRMLRSTQHGQQLLQVWLSLMLTAGKDRKLLFAPDPLSAGGMHVPLMHCVAGDIQAYLTSSSSSSSSSDGGSSQQKQQQQQLPDPQLVGCVLALAAQHCCCLAQVLRRFERLSDDAVTATSGAESLHALEVSLLEVFAPTAAATAAKTAVAAAAAAVAGDIEEEALAATAHLQQFTRNFIGLCSTLRQLLEAMHRLGAAADAGASLPAVWGPVLQQLLQHNGGALMSALLQSEASASAAGAAAGAALERHRQARMQHNAECMWLQKELDAAQRSADMHSQRCIGAASGSREQRQHKQIAKLHERQVGTLQVKLRRVKALLRSAPLADLRPLAPALDVLAQLLVLVVPSRYCCNSPRCSSLACISEGFAMVRGSSCMCGGCQHFVLCWGAELGLWGIVRGAGCVVHCVVRCAVQCWGAQAGCMEGLEKPKGVVREGPVWCLYSIKLSRAGERRAMTWQWLRADLCPCPGPTFPEHRYCSVECQRVMHTGHRLFCKSQQPQEASSSSGDSGGLGASSSGDVSQALIIESERGC